MTFPTFKIAGLVMALLMAVGNVGAESVPKVELRMIQLPVGAIVAFQSACPADGNWDHFQAASGRFLLGAGDIPGTDVNAPPSTTDEPEHIHDVGSSTRNVRKDDDGSDSHVAQSGHGHEVRPAVSIPPYYAVVFCILK